MKHILLAGLLSFGSVASPVFAEPASAQSQMESIQDMAVWMQSMTTIEVDLASLFSADSMSNLFAAIDSSDNSEIKRFGRQFEAERQVVLARARGQIAELEAPEKWNIDRSLFSRQDTAIYKAAKNQFDGLQESYQLYENLTKSFSDILNNPENLDGAGLEELLIVQHQAGVRMIELENRQIDGYILAIPKDNPNHQFQKIVKQFNLATIPELEISTFENTLEERRIFAKDMGRELGKIRPLILEGKRNAQTSLKNLERLSTQRLSPENRIMVPISIELYKSFGETFEVETQMLNAMNASYELYLSDKSDEEIQSSIDENDLAFFRLVQERTKLMQQRLSLLQ